MSVDLIDIGYKSDKLGNQQNEGKYEEKFK